MKKTIFILCALVSFQCVYAHVGSPGVLYEGVVGKYHIIVNIDPPVVIPGTASVSVFVQGNPGDISLSAMPVYWSAGKQGTPKSDQLLPSMEEAGKFVGEIWYMNFGSSSVAIQLKDDDGEYEVVVPVMAVSTAQNKMEPSLGITLAILGLLLVVLLVTIISSSMSDGLLKPGETPTPAMRRKKSIGMVAGTILIFTILYFGKTWWENWAKGYERTLYKPFEASAQVVERNDGDYIRLTVDSTVVALGGTFTRNISYLVPDHGKLMHLFLVKEGTLDAFAHLHPRRIDSLNFETKLPPLPPGTYHVFADVSRFSGFSETIVSTLTVDETPNLVRFAGIDDGFDRDDTYLVSNAIGEKNDVLLDEAILICGSPGMKTDLPGGYAAIWETNSNVFKAGKLYALDFALFAADGSPAVLQPYLGMMGHAVVMRSDGSVYIHLHPTGNYSMASQQVLLDRFESGVSGWSNLPKTKSFADSIDQVIALLDQLPENERDSLLMVNMNHEFPTLGDESEHPEHSMVRFPYAFPKAGDYRVWLQVKIGGEIVNGAFDVSVVD